MRENWKVGEMIEVKGMGCCRRKIIKDQKEHKSDKKIDKQREREREGKSKQRKNKGKWERM